MTMARPYCIGMAMAMPYCIGMPMAMPMPYCICLWLWQCHAGYGNVMVNLATPMPWHRLWL